MHLQAAHVGRRPDIPCWAFAVIGLWLSLVAGAVVLSNSLGRGVELCLFHRVTGLPCPTCGTTRGVLAMLSGRAFAAWAYNPLVFTVAAVWTGMLIVRMITGRSLRLRLTRRQRAVGWALFAVAAAINWLYVILYVG